MIMMKSRHEKQAHEELSGAEGNPASPCEATVYITTHLTSPTTATLISMYCMIATITKMLIDNREV